MNLKPVLTDFMQVLALAKAPADRFSYEIKDRGCPHVPAPLPKGKMAIYIFLHGERVLKVGKVGPNSNARFQSQHYSPQSSGSNLAKRLLDDSDSPCREFEVDEVGSWMKRHLRRIDILLDEAAGTPVLSLLEAFCHYRLQPRYEGFKSQSPNAVEVDPA